MKEKLYFCNVIFIANIERDCPKGEKLQIKEKDEICHFYYDGNICILIMFYRKQVFLHGVGDGIIYLLIRYCFNLSRKNSLYK